MLAVFLLFIVLSSGAVFGCLVLEKEYKFGEYAPVSCMATVLALFIFGLFGLLKTGFWILAAGSAAVYAIALLKIIKNGNFKTQKKSFFTQGFWVYVLLFASVVWINYGMQAHDWDEFSHWALVVKEMNAVNVLPSNPSVRFTFYKTYPPAMPLFEYFLLKLNGGVFNEWLLYAAYQVFLLSLFMPFIEKLNLSKWYNWLFVPAMWLVPLAFYGNVYSGLYIDPFLGVLSGTCFGMLVLNDGKTALQKAFILLGASVLTLSKEIGILLAVFLIIAYILSEKNVRSLWCVVSVAVPEALWKILLKVNGVTGQTRGAVDFNSFMNVVSGREDSYRPQVLRAFFIMLKNGFLLDILLILTLLLAICILRKKRFVFWLIFAQTFIYIFGMLLMYMYMFTWQEALAMASYPRYIGVVVLALSVCLVLSCIDLPVKNHWLPPTLLLVLAVVAAPKAELFNTVSRRNVSLASSIRQPIEDGYCRMIREEYEPGSRVCYGSGDLATMEFFESRYILAPDYDIYWDES